MATPPPFLEPFSSDVVITSTRSTAEAWNHELQLFKTELEAWAANGTLPKPTAKELRAIVKKHNAQNNNQSQPIDFWGVSRKSQIFLSKMVKGPHKMRFVVSPYYFPTCFYGDERFSCRVLDRTPLDGVQYRDDKRVWVLSAKDRKGIFDDQRRTKARLRNRIIMKRVSKVRLPYILVGSVTWLIFKFIAIPLLNVVSREGPGYVLAGWAVSGLASVFGYFLTR